MSLARPARRWWAERGTNGWAVTWLMILEQMQQVLGAQEGPVSQQSVVFVRQSAPAPDGDQPRITLFREDRHSHAYHPRSDVAGVRHERAVNPSPDRPSLVERRRPLGKSEWGGRRERRAGSATLGPVVAGPVIAWDRRLGARDRVERQSVE